MNLSEKRKFGLIEHIGITYRASLSFKHVKGSNFLNELLIPIATMVLLPMFLFINLFVIPFHNGKINKKINKPVK